MNTKPILNSLRTLLRLFTLVACIGCTRPLAAQEPALLPLEGTLFQGYLTDGAGPANGLYDLEFRFFTELTIYSAAAIQELNQKLTEELKRRDAENAELKQRLGALEQIILDRQPH